MPRKPAWNKGMIKIEPPDIISRSDLAYTNYKTYRNRVTARTAYTYKIFKEEINPLNLPRGTSGTDGAYQLDHIISVRTGFEQNISIEEMSARENLQMLAWLDNIKKGRK